jgi:hypothetical protein
MARYLKTIGIPYKSMAKYADYYPHVEGSMPGGRSMDPADYNAAKLGIEGLKLLPLADRRASGHEIRGVCNVQIDDDGVRAIVAGAAARGIRGARDTENNIDEPIRISGVGEVEGHVEKK